ncbi:protein N-lysine methyltransferase METTL21A-like [Mercenaria mercenaria]|uniref:protein N-lysine methyltransferase METTL21A-like n=1 Tax=Mercenaria mercenaria TaxID=6596 RepID=UPI00234E4401|nr:protein N-lysine methyltransferase METTL21A-like [Mercenaria mercenaria]
MSKLTLCPTIFLDSYTIYRYLILSSICIQFAFCQSCKSTPFYDSTAEQCKASALGFATAENMNNALAVVVYNEDSVFPLHKPERTFKYCDRDIVIKQDWSGLGVAAVVWDAAEVLSEYLENSADIVKDKTVIELGAGTGLVGIVASLLGAKTTITDREEVLQYLQTTVKSNLPGAIYKNTQILPLDWTRDLDKFHTTYDVILGADIVYIEEVFDDLLSTLIQLSNKETVILLSCRIRYDRDTNFLNRLEDHFDVVKVLYSKEKDVNLYKMTKR